MNNLSQPPISHTPSWAHQCEAYWFAQPQRATMLALGMGAGKSLVAVNLCVNDSARRIAIACPKTVIPVWHREFKKHAPDYAQVVLLNTGSSAKNLKLARQYENYACPVAFVINYEGMHLKGIGEWFLSKNWDVVVTDESHKIKSPNGKASKFAYRLGQRAQRRLCLTGTPLPHSPLDVFGQYRFLNETIYGPSYWRFRNRYAQCHPQFKSKVLKWLNENELQAKMHSIMFRVRSEDVLDLPEEHHQRLTFDLCPSAAKHYREMKQDFVTGVKDGVTTASNALVKLLRLQQITSGHLKLEDDRTVEITDTGKRGVLLELLEGLPTREPVVVFCRFDHDVSVCEALAAETGRRFGKINSERKDLTEDAEMPDDIDLLAVQIQSGGTGVDLTRACYVAYYSMGYSLGDYEQSMKRIHRPGQTRPVRYYHIVANETVDVEVYAALSKRKQVVEAILQEIQNDEPITA